MSIETLRRICARRAQPIQERDERLEDYRCDCGTTVSWDGVARVTCPTCGQVFGLDQPAVRTALVELADYLRLMGDIEDGEPLLPQDLRDVQRLARAFLASLKK